MQDHDLQKIWVTAFDDDRGGGEFSLLDERTGERKQLTSTFPQALGVAIRYREPFLLERDALLSANADFVDRMVINPKGEFHLGLKLRHQVPLWVSGRLLSMTLGCWDSVVPVVDIQT